MSTSTLTVHRSIVEVVRLYEQADSDIREAYAKVAAAEDRLNACFTMEHWCGISIREESYHRSSVEWHDPKTTLDRLKRDVWRALVQRLEIRRAISIERAKQLDEQLEKGALPEITEESVLQFAQQYLDNIGNMLNEAVAEVFEWLRPRRSRYKTNTELEIGPKVVLSRVVEEKWNGNGFRVEHDRQKYLTALENVFTALDGNGWINKMHFSALQNAIDACGPDGVGETEYFAFRCFKNRNLHLTFKRRDLLQRFNAIAGGKRLRPAEAAA